MYFDDCRDLNELKARYRELAMRNHPDLGGDLRTMQAINGEHDLVFERLKRRQNERARDPESHVRTTTETAEEFRNVVDLFVRMDGVSAELCGSWLWISGDTYDHRAELKSVGCMWSRSKQKWYWRHPEDWSRRGRGSTSMEDIRERYGSRQVVSDDDERGRDAHAKPMRRTHPHAPSRTQRAEHQIGV